MALSPNVVWEVQTGGAATNGGGFKAGASGTDYSQQAAAQLALTDVVANGTTTLTSATGGFTDAMIGNVIYLQGGTGSLSETRRVIATRSDTNTITVETDTVAAGTGISCNVGGALNTIAKAASVMVGSNWIFVKAGSGYTSTSTTTLSASVVPGNSTPPNRLTGYTTTRGDNGFATLTLSVGSGLTGLSATGNGWWIENMTIDCASLGTSTGIKYSGSYGYVRHCRVLNHTTRGIDMSGGAQSSVTDCEVTGGGASVSEHIACYGGVAFVARNYVHDNLQGIGIYTNQSGSVILWNLVHYCRGSNGNGITADTSNVAVIGNTVNACQQSGIRYTSGTAMVGCQLRNNLLTENGAYGINWSGASGSPAYPLWDGNAFWQNTSGPRNNMDSTAAPYSAAAYTRVLDVILTADPFTDSLNDDFTLNNVAGGGAACRSAGTPGEVLNGGRGYMDIGAFQAAASGGGLVIVRRGGTVMKM